MTSTPPPGSLDAIAQGCLCPSPQQRTTAPWVADAACPLHGYAGGVPVAPTVPARFRAAQKVAVAPGTSWVPVAALPEGEVIWHEVNDRLRDWVILTPEGWLVYVNGGDRSMDAKLPGMPATDEMLATLRGR